ncbi:hypothetical protein O181_091771 [Austropuccinia psidii MF-1]|uniref:Uncharacterized protein n=1 Tax=Austropuccinia psidii MF-1 TaxID=1389203 RepID=A0A9Q3IY32_9BASI|nr:hypothetical protein [Austropuccinia psidii MF-1]
MELDLKEGDQFLVSTLNFNRLKGPNKMRDSFIGPFTIIKLTVENLVDVRLTEVFCRKHPVFPVSLVKPYLQKGEDKLPPQKKDLHPTEHSGSRRIPWILKEDHPGQEDQMQW